MEFARPVLAQYPDDELLVDLRTGAITNVDPCHFRGVGLPDGTALLSDLSKRDLLAALQRVAHNNEVHVEGPSFKAKKIAFLIVDVQNDFLDGGAFAVPGSRAIIPVIEKLLAFCSSDNRHILSVASADWHPEDHVSFIDHGGPWPPHCREGTAGAELHAAVTAQIIIRKGMRSDRDAYSVFESGDPANVELMELLDEQEITHLWVAGVATDYCVKATVLDALGLGFQVQVITDAIAAINKHPDDEQEALNAMVCSGATLITSDELLTR